jgi:hypothetical protein
VDSTPVITKIDVKYGAEQLLQPGENKVAIDLIGKLDADVKFGHIFDGTLGYDPPQQGAAAGPATEVVFLLIYADSYPTDAQQKSLITFKVQKKPAATGAAPAPGAGAPAAASKSTGAAEGSGDDAGESDWSSKEQHQAQRKSVQQSAAQQKLAQNGGAGTPATDWTDELPLEFPIVLLGEGAVKMLTADPSHFQFTNKSQTTPVKVSVRIGRRLP